MSPVASVGVRVLALGAPTVPEAVGGDASSAAGKDEAARIRELQRIDSEVREHERAHQSAGGALTGAAKFKFERGPDGQLYAVAGEVPVSLGPGRTPEETLQRARTARAAAYAPANPSGADRAVAAMAAALEVEALRDIAEQARGARRSLLADMSGADRAPAPPMVSPTPQAVVGSSSASDLSEVGAANASAPAARADALALDVSAGFVLAPSDGRELGSGHLVAMQAYNRRSTTVATLAGRIARVA